MQTVLLCKKSLNEVMGKYGRWKNAVEGKGLRVNVDKTKGIHLLFGKKSISKVGPCGVCDEQVSCNYIQCTKCQVGSSLFWFSRAGGSISCRDVFLGPVLVIIVQ